MYSRVSCISYTLYICQTFLLSCHCNDVQSPGPFHFMFVELHFDLLVAVVGVRLLQGALPIMNIFFRPTSREFLSIFVTFCPFRGRFSQTVPCFTFFQMAARQAVMVLRHDSCSSRSSFCPATFNWGLKITTCFCVIVGLCFIQDQS